jgi:PAS domain S-box-containing protein
MDLDAVLARYDVKKPSEAFALVVGAVADALFFLDAEGRITYASDMARRVLGLDPQEVIERPFLDFVHPDDRELASMNWNDSTPIEREVRMRTGEEEWRWVGLAASAANTQEDRTGEGGMLMLVRDAHPEVARDRTDLFRRALDAIDNVLVITDPTLPDNPIVYANDNFLKVTGYRREEVIGRNCRFLQIAPDGTRDDGQGGDPGDRGETDQAAELEKLRVAIRDQTDVGVLLRNYRKDGALFYNNFFLNPVHSEEGDLVAFVGVQNDVTELVQSRTEVVGREKLLESFYTSAPLGMGVAELDEEDQACHRTANPIARALYDIDEREVSGQRGEDLGLTPEEAARWNAAFRRCRDTGAPVRFTSAHPWGAREQDEDVRLLDVVVNAAGQEGGRPLFAYVVEDVTEQRRNERERALLSQAIESFTEGVLITGPQLDEPGPAITYVNAAFEEMTGYSREELLGKTPRIFQGPKTDRAVLDRLRRLLEAGERYSGESINYRKDGSDYILDWHIVPIYGADGEITHWASMQHDVTERRRLEQEVLEVGAREQERIARDLHDGLGQTIAAAAMLCATSMQDLQEEGHALAASTERVYDLLRDAVQQARSLAHGLHPVNVKADGLMKALTHLTETASAAYGVDCTFVCEEPVLMAGHDRALHLYRIVQESITNAVRHGRADHIVVTLDVEADTDPAVPQGFISLSIQDDGAGISGEAFVQEDGIGLRSMRYRADRLGGRFEIGPREEGGTLVRVLFDPKGNHAPAL